jgi:pimeloyl-ACP methyl ester carboxylesterase
VERDGEDRGRARGSAAEGAGGGAAVEWVADEGKPIAEYADENDLNLDERLNLFREVCAAVGMTNINVKSQTRIFSKLPTLFVSGSLDANTPPFQAEEVRWGFPNSVHLVVENGGHETLPSPEVQTVIVDFFKGQDIKGRTVSLERPRFLSVEETKTQPTSRR